MSKRNWYDRVTSQFVQNVANIYLQEAGIPAFSIFPEITSRNLKGKIAKYDKEDWFYIGTVSDYIRSGATESAGDDYETSSQDYTLLKYSFHKDITEEESKEYDNPFDPVSDATKFVINRLRRVITQKLVSTYLTTSVWGTDYTGDGGGSNPVKWSDGSATPVKDVLGWQEDVHKVTGFRPNRMIVSPDVHRVLKTCTAITNVMKTTDDKVVTKALIAKLFELDEYVVIDTVNSGATDYMVSGKVLLIYTPKAPSKMEPSAGYTITYRGESMEAVGTNRIEMPLRNHSLRIEADVHACPIALATDLGIYAHTMV